MCYAGLVQEEIEKYRGENTSAESERQQALAELQGRLAETQEQAAWYTHKHEAAVKRVDQLKVCTPALAPPQKTLNPKNPKPKLPPHSSATVCCGSSLIRHPSLTQGVLEFRVSTA